MDIGVEIDRPDDLPKHRLFAKPQARLKEAAQHYPEKANKNAHAAFA
jgi:hypothetical protein